MKYKELETILEAYKEYDLSLHVFFRKLFHQKHYPYVYDESVFWYDEGRYCDDVLIEREQKKEHRISNLLYIIDDLKKCSAKNKENILNNIKILINYNFLNDSMFQEAYELFKQIPENEAKVLYDLVSNRFGWKCHIRDSYIGEFIKHKYYEKLANCNSDIRKKILIAFLSDAARCDWFDVKGFDAILNAKTDERALIIYRFLFRNRSILPGFVNDIREKITLADTDEKAFYISTLSMECYIEDADIVRFCSILILDSKSGEEAMRINRICNDLILDEEATYEQKMNRLDNFSGHNLYGNNTYQYSEFSRSVSANILDFLYSDGTLSKHIDKSFIIEDEIKKYTETKEEQQYILENLRCMGQEYINQTLTDALEYVDGDKEKEIPNSFFLNRKYE